MDGRTSSCRIRGVYCGALSEKMAKRTTGQKRDHANQDDQFQDLRKKNQLILTSLRRREGEEKRTPQTKLNPHHP